MELNKNFYWDENDQNRKHIRFSTEDKIKGLSIIAGLLIGIVIMSECYNSHTLFMILSICSFILLINAFIYLSRKCKENYLNSSHKWYFAALLTVDFAGVLNTFYLLTLILE
jgi:hypothetical protein